MPRALSFPAFLLMLAAARLATAPLQAQGMQADYELAATLGERTADKVVRDRMRPRWLENGRRFWYEVKDIAGVEHYYAVDVQTGEKTRLDAPPETALVEARRVPERRSRNGGEASTLVFENRRDEPVLLFWIDPGGQRQPYGRIQPGERRGQNTYARHVFLITSAAEEPLAWFQAQEEPSLAVIGSVLPPLEDDAKGPPVAEPARPFSAKIEADNIMATDNATGESFALTHDGTAQRRYQPPLSWSPDGARLVAFCVQPAKERRLQIIESSPRDRLQPRLIDLPYPKPGDVIDRPTLALFDVAARVEIFVDNALFPQPWSLSQFHWSPDGGTFYFLYNQRGHQVVRLLAVDTRTGSVRPIAAETSRTFIDYTNKVWHHWLDETGEVLWMSERDGWNHLYLFDATTGALKNQVTRGEWVVRRIERVDAGARQVWFTAMGARPGQSPYHQHLCRVNFDGSGFTVLTEGDGTHRWEFSPDGSAFIDRWSRVDQPPVTELRRSADGSLIGEIERGDASALLATGWCAPERFVAKGRDGATDIHGIIMRPTNFDPAKKYPVIEKIYAGPHDHFVPQWFDLMTHDRQLGELGFILVQIDGMGTNWRSKAFHDMCWKNLHDAGFPDRIAWLKAAAEKFPEMDLSRVGIYGGSAGGQSAMRALIDHGDFYQAAAADCGCHDNRMDKIWWNEQWMGWPVDASYEAASNVVHASRLQGRLLLTVGELDTNVDPASTMQVANALIQAGKDFELLVVPGAGHGVGEQPYPVRRRMDFFVRALWGAEPRR